MQDNKDAIARQILSTGCQLKAVEEALGSWEDDNKEGESWMGQFKMYVFHSFRRVNASSRLFRTLETELKKLNELNDESNFRKFLDHEDEQKRMMHIFECINEARVQFEVRASPLVCLPIFNSV